nr:UvrD-like helicase, ATP-binding domain, P-loop containing nucleoside triphosphate hydrolase [Tanacetum cinerariifolium]
MKTWFSQIQLASSDFNTDERVTWVEIEGIPLKMWSKNTFNRVASKCGVLLDVDDQEDEHFPRKRICINTNVPTNIFESFKLIYRGKVFWVSAKEVPGWIPDFVEDNDEEEDSKVGSYEEAPNGEDVKNVEDLEGDSDGEIVPDTKFEEDFPNQKGEEDSVGQGNVQSEDPFNIYELLNHKRPVIEKNSNSKESLKYPPRYTPTESKEATREKQFDSKKNPKNDVKESICSGHFKKSKVPKSGGSILQLIDNLVKVGETMGYDMKGCIKNMEEIIELQGANDGLEEVPLEGCSFTWCHRSATKMSKLDCFLISDSLLCSCPNISSITLDWYLFDHRPILIREDAYIIESNALVRMMKKLKYLKEKIRMWNKLNKEKSHKSKRSLLAELADCDAIIDKGEGENNVVNRRTKVVYLLQEVKKKNSLEAAQKAKIKWAIEDVVTCFFHQGSFPKGGNSSFIILIPKTPNANMVKDYSLVNEIQLAFVANKQILDGPFILNELVQWCKKKNKKSLVFKVNFEKTYDSVRWDHLDEIMRKFGFGEKWCIWIQISLWSSRGSVIMNGSQWSEPNIDTIVKVLDWFNRASGLRINMTNSKLLGISVEDDKVKQEAAMIGCNTLKTPFSYLGSKVGGYGKAMINSIKNGDQPLPRVTQESIAGTTSTEQPPLKDKSMWSDQEKRVQKIDHLERSLLIQGIPNDIYSLIDSNKTVKDLWDALARHMLGSEYSEQDRKATVLYEYETFKATEGELLLDTYIRYLQVINDLKKCGYSKDNCELNFKFLNNKQPEWKQYATMMRQNKNLMDINIDALYNILKQNQGDVND